jgi:hypothetical protein
LKASTGAGKSVLLGRNTTMRRVAPIRVIDVTTPSAPIEVAARNTVGDTVGVTVAGGLIYAGESDAGLGIYTASSDIFRDGFESGDVSAWSSSIP